MLVLSEFAEESKQDVHRLDQRLIIVMLVHGDISEAANQSGVVGRVHVDFGAWEVNLAEGSLHFRVPLLHEVVDVWHILRVVHGRRGTSLVEVAHAVDPAVDFLLFLVGVLDRVHVERGRTHNILGLDILELQDSFVFVVERRFIEHRDTEVLLVSIRFGHLEERVDLSHRRDVVWDEGLDPGLKIDLLGLVPRDVLKELFDL